MHGKHSKQHEMSLGKITTTEQYHCSNVNNYTSMAIYNGSNWGETYPKECMQYRNQAHKALQRHHICHIYL